MPLESFYIPPRSEEDRRAIERVRARYAGGGPLVIPRSPDVLERCGIQREEITPNSVITITHPLGTMADRAELEYIARQLAALAKCGVVLLPEGVILSQKGLAELRELREQLNASIYDLEKTL
jgi:hypothetical protein